MTANKLVPLSAGIDAISSPKHTIQSPTTPMPSTSFSHQPLSPESDCTRFIEIETAQSDDEPVSCRLVEIAFGDRPRFHAVSYMWGDGASDNQHTILVNGLDFRVGRNLWDALRHLRHEYRDTRFWIDGICIDQNNLAERNQQVRMMGQIYFRARTVIVWLGSKYAEYQEHLRSEDLPSTMIHSEDAEPKADSNEDNETTANTTGPSPKERQLARSLLGDSY